MEVFQSIRDERLTTCPECSKDGLRRMIGLGAGIIFKGSGFYQTDYKKTQAPQTETSAKTATASGESASSKPAAATAGDKAKTSTTNNSN